MAGYLFFFSGLIFGFIDTGAAVVFFIAAFSFGLLLSAVALLLEEISFHVYPEIRHTPILLLVVTLENFGYRQLNPFWRLEGMLRWLFKVEGHWGHMQRVGHDDTAGKAKGPLAAPGWCNLFTVGLGSRV